MPSPEAREDTMFNFLEQELFIANTFASITNFSIHGVNESSRPTISEWGGIFVEFLNLIEMVTSLERQATTETSVVSGITLSGLRKLFEHARSRVQRSNAYDYLHLGRAVNCFYHAGLIYGCRRWDPPSDSGLYIPALSFCVPLKFSCLSFIGRRPKS